MNVIEHRGRHGCIFTSTSRDLSTGVQVQNSLGCSPLKAMQDYFEFGCWFGVTILPTLPSFRGYDTVTLEHIPTKKELA